jgi:hypothetical protein
MLFLGGHFLWCARVVNSRRKDGKRNPSAVAYAVMGLQALPDGDQLREAHRP